MVGGLPRDLFAFVELQDVGGGAEIAFFLLKAVGSKLSIKLI